MKQEQIWKTKDGRVQDCEKLITQYDGDKFLASKASSFNEYMVKHCMSNQKIPGGLIGIKSIFQNRTRGK